MIARYATPDDIPGINNMIDGYDGPVPIDRERVKHSGAALINSGGLIVAIHLGVIVGGAGGYYLPCGFNGDIIFAVMFLYMRPRRRRHVRWFLRQVEFQAGRQANRIVYAVPVHDRSEKHERFFRMLGYSRLEVHVEKRLTNGRPAS